MLPKKIYVVVPGGDFKTLGAYFNQEAARLFAEEQHLRVDAVDLVDLPSHEAKIAGQIADVVSRVRASIETTQDRVERPSWSDLVAMLAALESDVREGRWRP